MNIIDVCLAGDGWGAVAVAKGIKYPIKISEVLTEDNDIKKLCKDARKIIQLEDSEAKIVICSGYKHIIKKDILRQKKIINIHPSMLPKYRGLHSLAWALLNNEDEVGITVHIMNEYIDDGPILFQYSMKNDRVSSAQNIMLQLLQNIQDNIQKIVIDYDQGLLVPVSQDKKLATWCGKRNIDDCEIDLYASPDRVSALLRVLQPPYPYPFLWFKEEKIIIKSALLRRGNARTQIGRVLNIDNEGIWIESNDAYVILKEIEDEYRKKYDFTKIKVGEFFDRYRSRRYQL